MPEQPEVPEVQGEASELSHWQQHRFLIMVFGAIGASLVLVVIAMALYINSTAIELDLSRPAYQSVRDQAGKDTSATNFPSTGPVDTNALKSFRDIFTKQYDRAVGTDSFDKEALSDQALELPVIQN